VLKRVSVAIVGAVGVLLVWAAPAAAQAHVGLRAGVSGGPGQFVFGAHVDTPELITSLTFRPNVEVGVGDNRTLAGVNVEFAYWIPITDTDWKVYFPVGPALVITSHHGDHGDTNVGGGFNLGVGVQHVRGLFTELKAGFGRSPSVRFSVGYVF